MKCFRMHYLRHFLQTTLRLGTIPHSLSIAILVLVAAAESRVARCLLATALLCVLAREARAVDRAWRNPDGGTFSIASNWFGGVPGASDVATFGLSTSGPLGALPPYTVSFTADATNQGLRVSDDRVTFDLNGHVYTTTASVPMQLGTVSSASGQLGVLDGIIILPFQSDLQIATTSGGSGLLAVAAGGLVIGSPEVFVGVNGNGTLNIFDNGDLIANDATIGVNAGSSGVATISGGGSSLLADELIVGGSGAGTLDIIASGRVDSTTGIVGNNAGGAVTVDGIGSRWDNAGGLAVLNGTLSVTAGGRVDSASGFVGNIGAGPGAVTVDGVGSLWDNAGALTVGNGTLSVTAGGRVDSTSGIVGGDAVGMSAVTVDGVGSRWENTGGLSVGFFIEGTLNITAGGTVHTGSSSIGSSDTGTVTVDGAGSLLDSTSGITVGNFAAGTLSITNGGHVQSTGGSTVGDLSPGLVTVDGEGSQWQLGGSLRLGDSAPGTLEIIAGGSVQSQGALLGQRSFAHATVTVDGDGSLWNNTSGSITVGDQGDATLLITDGGTVATGSDASIGQQSSSTGTVTVDGDGSLWSNTAGSITVGDQGVGTLLIAEGGKVITGSDANIGQQLFSTGTVIVSSSVATADSVWEIGGRLSLSLNPDPLTSQGVGTVRIQPGGKVTVGQDTVVASGDLVSLEGGAFTTSQISFERFGSAGANFQWTSGTLHVGLFQGNLVNSAGVLSPGSSIGTTLIQGNYNQLTDAALEIEIGPLGQSPQHDSVSVTGTATIDGQLVLKLINGAAPLSSQTFIILDAATLIGSFNNVANGQRLITTDGLGSFLVNYGAGSAFDPTQVVLSAFAAAGHPGDFDSDGDVDGADFVVWQTNFPKPNGATLAQGDADGDGDIDGADFVVWQTNFPFTPNPGALSIPEPKSILLAAIAAFVLVLSIRCRPVV